MIEPLIKSISDKKLVGISVVMSLAENKTFNLWQNFMPQRKNILNNVGTDLISMQLYDKPLDVGNIYQTFDKWAAIEVSSFEEIPKNMKPFILPSGLYAVFHYKGLSSDTSIFRYIFGDWLPNSIYALDQRPHFEVLGTKYENNNPNSEEEIWIPIKHKY